MTFTRRYRLDALANTCAELHDDALSAIEALAQHYRFKGPQDATSPHVVPQGDRLEATRADESEASPEGRSAGDHFRVGDRVRRKDGFSRPTDTDGTVATVYGVGRLYTVCVDWDDTSSSVIDAPCLERAPYGIAANDFDLDAATREVRTDIAEADCNALEALTGPGVPDWQPVPGEQVEVVEAVGSRTGPRRAIGTFVGWEEDEKDPGGERWRLVEVYGVIRRFRAVGRVG